MPAWIPTRPMMGSRAWPITPRPPTIASPLTSPGIATPIGGGYGGYLRPGGSGYAGSYGAPSAMPNAGSYFQPGSNYGAAQSAITTPIVSGPAGYFAENPQAAFTRYTAPFAGGEDPFSRFVRNQYGQAYQGFQSALGTNPNLSFLNQYLPGLGGEQYFRNRFLQQAPSLRGEQPGTLGGGRLRWFLNR